MSATIDPASRWTRELSYYKHEVNRLGAKLLRVQEEQFRTFLEARRSRTVVKLLREAYRAGDAGATLEETMRGILDAVIENTMCDRAALLRETPRGTGTFVLQQIAGLGDGPHPRPLVLRDVPAYLYTAGSVPPPPAASDLTAFLGLDFILWNYDPSSGYALLIGNSTESNLHRPFEEGDHELIEAALSVTLDSLSRLSLTTPVAAALAPATGAFNSGAPAFAIDTLLGIEEAEIKKGLRDGGCVSHIIAVEHQTSDGLEYLPYLLVSWSRGYRMFQTFRRRAPRSFRDVGRFIQLARSEYDYPKSVTVYAASAPEITNLRSPFPSETS